MIELNSEGHKDLVRAMGKGSQEEGIISSKHQLRREGCILEGHRACDRTCGSKKHAGRGRRGCILKARGKPPPVEGAASPRCPKGHTSCTS